MSDSVRNMQETGYARPAAQLVEKITLLTTWDRFISMESRRSIRLERLVEVLARTAADLTRIQDTEQVLAAICSRTRLLIDSDMAYISLNDPLRGETYIRATDGVRSDSYRNIRMPLGTGVLGTAATGERTFMTTDYSEDESFIHLPTIDDAVEEEGVRAILAAPLKIEGTVIGALLVADRTHREFLPEERLTIESLTPLAAVAVENARRFEEQRVALDRERAARADASSALARVRRLADAERAFGDALSSRAGIDALVHELADWLGAPAAAFDALGRPLASTFAAGSAEEETAAQRMRAALEAAGRGRSAAGGDRGATAAPGSGIALSRAQDALLGGLVVAEAPTAARDGRPRHPDADPETDAVILQRASSHLAALLLFQRTLDDSRYRQERDLMSALAAFDPADDPRPLERSLLKLSSATAGRPEARALVVVEIEQELHLAAMRELRGSGTVSVLASHEGHICGVIDSDRTSPAAIAGRIRTVAPDFQGGVSALPGIPDAARAHAEAQRLARALAQLGRGGEIADRGTLGAAGLMLGGAGDGTAAAIIAEHLGPLLDYDAEHGTALTETCETWLDSGRSIPVAAGRLFIHPNTVRQRLDRIAVLLGAGWEDGSRSFDLHLALRLHRLGGNS